MTGWLLALAALIVVTGTILGLALAAIAGQSDRTIQRLNAEQGDDR